MSTETSERQSGDGGRTPASDPFSGVRNVEVNGATLAYRERGEGEPVVFVHGSVSDLRTWERQLPALAASHRAISYSRRYARPNADIPAETDDQMAPHVEDLVSLLTALDAAPAHLVGNSWGAFVCLLAAIRHPRAVRSLVLEEPPVLSLFVSNPPRPSELMALLARRPRTALTILGFGARTITPAQRAFRRGDDEAALRIFAIGVLGREGYERVPEPRMEQVRENLSAFRAQLLGAGFPPLADRDVRGAAAPTLLMTGERTPAVHLRLTDRLEELLPNAQRIEIPGASHRMHEENPAAVNEAILRFLGRRGRGDHGHQDSR